MAEHRSPRFLHRAVAAACWAGILIWGLQLVLPGQALRMAGAAGLAYFGAVAARLLQRWWRRLAVALEVVCESLLIVSAAGPVRAAVLMLAMAAAHTLVALCEVVEPETLWMVGSGVGVVAGSLVPSLRPPALAWIAAGPVLACAATLEASADGPPGAAARRALWYAGAALPLWGLLWALWPAHRRALLGADRPAALPHLSVTGIGTALAVAPLHVLGLVARPLAVAVVAYLAARMVGRRVRSVLVGGVVFALLLELFAPWLAVGPTAGQQLAALASAGASLHDAVAANGTTAVQAIASLPALPSGGLLEAAQPQLEPPTAAPAAAKASIAAPAPEKSTAGPPAPTQPVQAAAFLSDQGQSWDYTFAQVGQMKVGSLLPTTPYIRQQAYDVYTGGGWRAEPADVAGLSGGYTGPGTEGTATVTMDAAQDPLATPWFSTAVTVGGHAVTPDADWTWWTTPFVAGAHPYTARFVVPDMQQLATQLTASTAERSPDPVYLQLPATLPPRVRVLAQDVVAQAHAATPWTKAVALASWLQATYPYDLRVTPPPVGVDWADYFLFTARQGYCMYFATAMTVMARVDGIPARLATGYSPPAPGGQAGVYTIWLPGHAWAELYFPAVGWVPFDATSGNIADPQDIHGARPPAVGAQQWATGGADTSGQSLIQRASQAAGTITQPNPALPAPTPAPSGSPSGPSASLPGPSASTPAPGGTTDRRTRSHASGTPSASTGGSSAGGANPPPPSGGRSTAEAGRSPTHLPHGLSRDAWLRWGWLPAVAGGLLASALLVVGAERVTRSDLLGRMTAWASGQAGALRRRARWGSRGRPSSADARSGGLVTSAARGSSARAWRLSRRFRLRTDPRTQVLQAYVRVERALAESGHPRPDTVTVRAHLQPFVAAGNATLAALADLFHQARYRTAPVPPEAGDQAVRSARTAQKEIRDRARRAK